MLRNTLHLLLVGLLAGLVISGCVVKDDPCDGVTCDGHGDCTEYQGEALCACDTGYETSEDGKHCVLTSYMISLTWSFDGVGCTAAQVASVDVTLFEGATELANETIPCNLGDGANIEDVEDGTYDIELRATSNSGEMTYYGEGSVTVSGQDAALDITLEPVGFVVFTWDMGGLTCTAAGVERVRVMINTEDGSSNLYTANPPPFCSELGHSTEDTAFFYLGNYNLVMEGVCTDTFVHYDYDAVMMVTEKGENNYGNLSLDAIGGGCP
jgi:hypothetical protein